MANRNMNRNVAMNTAEAYRKLRKSRGKESFILQYRSPVIDYPTQGEHSDLEFTRHIWKVGDRFYKLAHEYYGDSKYWWAIALFNKTPTESHVRLGQTIFIPLPLDRVLLYAGVY
jgi:nucleoid-associated protein YgaU|tara:strand:+ start:418 stop:762 length:345 start_codon:yes stop_codon:yes gene_type:complete